MQTRGDDEVISSRKTIYRWLICAAALAIAAALAGCSSSNSSSSSSSTAASSSATSSASGNTTSDAIKIGIVCTCSGPAGSAFLAGEQTLQAWADTVNTSGGTSGHQVQVITEDDAANPGTAVTEVQGLLSQHVAAIVDLSDVDQAWVTPVESAGVPIIPGPQSVYDGPDFYPVGQTQGASIIASYVAVAREAGAANLGLFYCNVAACQESKVGIQAAGAQAGVPLVFSTAISLTQTDFTAQCLAAQQAKVAALIVATSPSGIETAAANCTQQGYHPIYIGLGSEWSVAMGSQPGLKDNTWSAYEDLPFFASNPAITAMNTALDKYYPGVRTAAATPTGLLVQMWAAGLVVADAVKAANITATAAPTAAQLTQGLEALHGDTLQGLAPPLTYPAGKDHPVNCWFIGHVTNGVASISNGGKPSCIS